MTSEYRLTPAYRLAGAAAYKAVLTRGSRAKSRTAKFDVKYLPNAQGHARLGYVVPKRLVPRAVHRNHIKRSIRELFRLHRCDLPAVDLVVRPISRVSDLSRKELVEDIRYLIFNLKQHA